MERIPRTLPSTGLSPAHRLPPALLPRRPSGALAGLPAVRLRRPLPAGAGPLDRLAGPAPPAAAAGCAASPFPAVSLGARKMPGVEGPGAELAPAGRGLAARPWRAARAGRNLCQRPAQGHLLPGLELGTTWDRPRRAVPGARRQRGRPRRSSCIRCSGTGRRSCADPHALRAPARCPPPRAPPTSAQPTSASPSERLRCSFASWACSSASRSCAACMSDCAACMSDCAASSARWSCSQ